MIATIKSIFGRLFVAIGWRRAYSAATYDARMARAKELREQLVQVRAAHESLEAQLKRYKSTATHRDEFLIGMIEHQLQENKNVMASAHDHIEKLEA